jgi:hypothetical protein
VYFVTQTNEQWSGQVTNAGPSALVGNQVRAECGGISFREGADGRSLMRSRGGIRAAIGTVIRSPMKKIALCAVAAVLAIGLVGAPATAQTTYSDSRAGLTLEGKFINQVGACGDYPMYQPGGTVEAVATITNANIQRPQGFSFNTEMYQLTPEGWQGESLGIMFAYPIVPAGEQVEVPISLPLPTSANGLLELEVRLYAMADNAKPSSQSKGPPTVQLNMVFCTPEE